jgi:hypothetical protein
VLEEIGESSIEIEQALTHGMELFSLFHYDCYQENQN